MSWVFIGLVIAVIYFAFFHKKEIASRNDAEGKDNWERFNFYGSRIIPAIGRYHISYKDQRGIKTERDIEIKRAYESNGKYAVDAHCFLRNDYRSFVGERIQKASNLDSGEIVDDLVRDAISQYFNSGAGRALTAIDKEWRGVAVLLFVCRADGRMMKSERAIVAEFLKRRCSNIIFDDAELDTAIKNLEEPDKKEFKRIIQDLKNADDQDQLNDLLDCAKRIVETQKKIDPMEKAAIEIITEATMDCRKAEQGVATPCS